MRWAGLGQRRRSSHFGLFAKTAGPSRSNYVGLTEAARCICSATIKGSPAHRLSSRGLALAWAESIYDGLVAQGWVPGS